jgi:hypothetical protein
MFNCNIFPSLGSPFDRVFAHFFLFSFFFSCPDLDSSIFLFFVAALPHFFLTESMREVGSYGFGQQRRLAASAA